MHINNHFFLSQYVEVVFQLDVTCPFEGVRGRKVSVAKNKRETGKNLTSELKGHSCQRLLRRPSFRILFPNFFP